MNTYPFAKQGLYLSPTQLKYNLELLKAKLKLAQIKRRLDKLKL